MAFLFYKKFDQIVSNELTLHITEKYPGDQELLPFYYYDIFNSNKEKIGKISIRIGHNFHSYYNGHIGYEVFEGYRGNCLAYKACKMVIKVARFHGMRYLYLSCDESNIASYKTIEKLGADLIEICSVPKEYFGWYEGMKPQRIYKLLL